MVRTSQLPHARCSRSPLAAQWGAGTAPKHCYSDYDWQNLVASVEHALAQVPGCASVERDEVEKALTLWIKDSARNAGNNPGRGGGRGGPSASCGLSK